MSLIFPPVCAAGNGVEMPLRSTKDYSVGIIYFILFILTIPGDELGGDECRHGLYC